MYTKISKEIFKDVIGGGSSIVDVDGSSMILSVTQTQGDFVLYVKGIADGANDS